MISDNDHCLADGIICVIYFMLAVDKFAILTSTEKSDTLSLNNLHLETDEILSKPIPKQDNMNDQSVADGMTCIYFILYMYKRTALISESRYFNKLHSGTSISTWIHR